MTLIFAGHLPTQRSARDVIKRAMADGATRDDFEKELVWHLYKNVPNPEYRNERFKETAKRLDKMWH